MANWNVITTSRGVQIFFKRSGKSTRGMITQQHHRIDKISCKYSYLFLEVHKHLHATREQAFKYDTLTACRNIYWITAIKLRISFEEGGLIRSYSWLVKFGRVPGKCLFDSAVKYAK